MNFSVATWNINSVRLRAPIVERLLREHRPDVLCLQETKCPNELFPEALFRSLGYEHIEVHGQKGYHGVATLSRFPLEDPAREDFGDVGHSRHLSTRVDLGSAKLRLHNFYVPAGGDEPDPLANPKFRHKLDFLAEMKTIDAEREPTVLSLLVGDLNVAPFENDVWSHKQMLKIVSHTPVECDALLAAQSAGRWTDLMRQHVPLEERLYTWWSYRARDWAASDRGRRLDHMWGSASLAPKLRDIAVLREARGWDRPSDHVPVIATFEL